MNSPYSMYFNEHRCIAYHRENHVKYRYGFILIDEIENQCRGFKIGPLEVSTLPNPFVSHHLYSSIVCVDMVTKSGPIFILESGIIQEIVVVLPEALMGPQIHIGYFPVCRASLYW